MTDNEFELRSGADRRYCQHMPEDCVAHSGQDVKIASLEGAIKDKLTFNTWLLGILIVMVFGIGGYINLALNSQNQSIVLLKERQDGVLKWIEKESQRMDNYEKGVYQLQGYDAALKQNNGK